MKLLACYLRFPFIPAIVAVALVAGCNEGPQIVPLEGKVTYKGEPLQFGSVMLQPTGGQPATATIQPDGSFVLSTNRPGDGATVGTNRVRVACFAEQAPGPEGLPDREQSFGESLIPVRYTDLNASGLVVEVKPSDNEDLLIELVD